MFILHSFFFRLSYVSCIVLCFFLRHHSSFNIVFSLSLSSVVLLSIISIVDASAHDGAMATADLNEALIGQARSTRMAQWDSSLNRGGNASS